MPLAKNPKYRCTTLLDNRSKAPDMMQSSRLLTVAQAFSFGSWSFWKLVSTKLCLAVDLCRSAVALHICTASNVLFTASRVAEQHLDSIAYIIAQCARAEQHNMYCSLHKVKQPKYCSQHMQSSRAARPPDAQAFTFGWAVSPALFKPNWFCHLGSKVIQCNAL